MPTFYQTDLFKALVASGDVDLQVVFAKDLSQERIDLGWRKDLQGYSHRFLDNDNPVLDAVRLAWSQRHRVHVVNGLWAEPAFAAALVVFALTGSAYAIYSEAPERIKFQSKARRHPFKYLLQTVFSKIVIPRVAGALAISRFSAQFFKDLGVSECAIYPFGYFRSRPSLVPDAMASSGQERTIEVAFVGRLVALKRLDLLIDAISPLFEMYPTLSLILIGGGELQDSLRQQVQALGLAARVSFEGAMSPDGIPARLVHTDVLVLPSKGEGWGLVVNEALSVGVPVILSDRCGAAELIRNGANGYVFKSEDVQHLRDRLGTFLSRKAEWHDFRAESRATGETISTDVVAPYLIECLRHMTGFSSKRPTPPWNRSSTTATPN